MADQGSPPDAPDAGVAPGPLHGPFVLLSGLRQRWLAAGVAVIVGLVATLVFIVHPGGLATSRHVLKGELLLLSTPSLVMGTNPYDGSTRPEAAPGIVGGDVGSCYGTNGFDDITIGTEVTIKDQGGSIIGETTLGKGVASSESLLDCTFKFKATVPDASFYQVTLGHRSGTLTYSSTDLKSKNWDINLELKQ